MIFGDFDIQSNELLVSFFVLRLVSIVHHGNNLKCLLLGFSSDFVQTFTLNFGNFFGEKFMRITSNSAYDILGTVQFRF